jgi:hypothetical protein
MELFESRQYLNGVSPGGVERALIVARAANEQCQRAADANNHCKNEISIHTCGANEKI